MIKVTKNKQEMRIKGITLVALVVTMIVRYDKNIKCCNIKGFLYFGYNKRWAKTYLFLIFLQKYSTERDIMKKVAIKNKIKSMNKNSRKILEKVILESIIDMNNKDYICKDMLERIVLMYLSLFSNRDYIEIEDLTKYEINIICKSILRGIVAIYLNEKYIVPKDRNIKMLIIDELIEFISLISNSQIIAVRVSVIKSIESYLNTGRVKELV